MGRLDETELSTELMLPRPSDEERTEPPAPRWRREGCCRLRLRSELLSDDFRLLWWCFVRMFPISRRVMRAGLSTASDAPCGQTSGPAQRGDVG